MRAALESLLRARKLDVTLAPFGPAGEPLAPALPVGNDGRVAPTGVAALDAALGGGLRRGHVSDVAGAPSSGRTTIVVGALAAATARGEAAALVDAGDTFDPASAAAQGVDLSLLLWVRPAGGPGGPGGDVAIALKAYALVLQAGGFGLVVLDVADVAPAALRRLPATTWMRLSRIVEGRDTAALLVGAERIARSAGGATIACETPAARWQGHAPRARVFIGLAAAPRVVGARR
jgi:recA bacterial DNA recombination protein